MLNRFFLPPSRKNKTTEAGKMNEDRAVRLKIDRGCINEWRHIRVKKTLKLSA